MMNNQRHNFQAFLQKKDVTILVVDSGLGGLAICADVARMLPRHHHFKTVSLIYFNAWPEQNRGYNRLEGKTEQIDVFDRALNSILTFKPDFIMLACNTLSVLYPLTKFYQNTTIPVVDIVDFGVEMMANAVHKRNNEQVVIVGTVTTIASRVHHDRLLQKGIPAKKIVLQPCDQLATAIENGPESPQVADMIQTFLHEAASKIDPSTKNVYGALCCTHFGYCQDQFLKILAGVTGKSATILNPNQHMTDYLLNACKDRGFNTRQRLLVVSKISWDKPKLSAISDRIRMISDETAQALTTYTHIPDLF